QDSFKNKNKASVYNDSSSSQNYVFKRNIKERKVRQELFILEYEDYFDSLSLKGKMNEVVKKGDDSFKSMFYEKGISGDLPLNWDDFRELTIQFCTDQDLDSVTKYREESWLNYCNRLKEFAIHRKISEDKIFKKLRTEFAPRSLQSLFYSIDSDISKLISRVSEIEENENVFEYRKNYNSKSYHKNNETENIIKQPIVNEVQSKKKSIVCFKCQKVGHYKNECPDIEKPINHLNITKPEKEKLTQE
ncbi:MAG: zinc finger CCHC domain-containing protein, partial [Fusobacteriaceae bacterium]